MGVPASRTRCDAYPAAAPTTAPDRNRRGYSAAIQVVEPGQPVGSLLTRTGLPRCFLSESFLDLGKPPHERHDPGGRRCRTMADATVTEGRGRVDDVRESGRESPGPGSACGFNEKGCEFLLAGQECRGNAAADRPGHRVLTMVRHFDHLT